MVGVPAAMIASAAISAGGSALGGALSSQGNQETKLQRQRRKLIDELVMSLKTGGGQFADLFSPNEEAFQRSIVEPSLSRFRNQIAPGIQQQFVQSGLQRGTGLEDQLARAGIDLQSSIDQQYGNFYENAMNRKQNALINAISGAEAAKPQTALQGAGQGFAGYLSSEGFGKQSEGFGNWLASPSPAQNQGNYAPQGRVGYATSANPYGFPNFLSQ